MDEELADLIADDPKAAWYALDCADARDSFHDFCGLVELPGVAASFEPPTNSLDDDQDDGSVVDLTFRPIETPPAAHHKILIDLCERLEAGKTRRAMVFMPPGSAKSTYASVAFPAWCMGRKRGRNVGVATYATGLARKVGRRIRSIVRQKVYHDVFGTTLSGDQSAADEWALDNGNEFMGAGLMAGWTGNRRHRLTTTRAAPCRPTSPPMRRSRRPKPGTS